MLRDNIHCGWVIPGGGWNGITGTTRGIIFESTRFHRPTVLSCEVIIGNQETPLIWVYLPLSTLDHLPDLGKDLNRFPGRDPVVLGSMNSEIVHLRNPRYQQVSDFLASFGLVDLLGHFQQRLHYRHLQTQWHFRRVLQSRCDYVLGLNRQKSKTVGIQHPLNFASDHFDL